MIKSLNPKPSNPNAVSFELFANATTELAKNRSDSVAITAIVGVVLAFITFVAVGGYVIYATSQSSNQGISQTTSVEQSE